jgi:Mg-chelatase subunit ChlD
MNHESQFTVHGDEALEARIVSWVLGEASAFEAAELERLCKERPELLVFRRRMRALHGLLTEAEACQPDRGWALPDSKRIALDELFGKTPVPSKELTIERRVRRSGRRTLLMIAACLILTVVIAGLMAPATLRQRKKADIRETPMIVTYDAMIADEKSAEAGAIADALPQGKVRLETELPPELIEGTPRPIILPGLGGAPARAKDQLASNARREWRSSALTAAPPASRLAEPAAPTSSMAERSARNGTAIPIPEIETRSEDSGSADAFGAGWGGAADGSAMAAAAGSRGPQGVESAGDGSNVDAIPEMAQAQAAAKPAPDMPVLGRLFAGEKNEAAPVRSNPALTFEHADKVDTVRHSLFAAEGNMQSGKPGGAERESSGALQKELASQAAGLGSERAAGAGLDSDRASYDHTRARLLAGLSSPAETSVPADETDSDYWDTSKVVAQEGEKRKEREIHAGYQSEYLFRGVDLSNDTAKIPNDAAELAKAIRDQEDKVEERRKVLATIVRTKGITYKGSDSFYEEKDESRENAIRRGLDAQDYVDAKKEFEKDQALLQQMKLKLTGDPVQAEPEPPKVDLASLIEEIPAAGDPYSTFSLNISDASFQIAQAALARGEQPDPAGIKVEQFYNAVDYGDPSPAAGEPVAAFIEQAAHPVIPGRNLVRIAIKTAAAGRSATQPLRLTLLVDQSGSMVREDRRAAMQKALTGLGGLLTDNDQVSVIGFSRTPRLLADSMPGGKAGQLAELVHTAASEGGTNLEAAIQLAEQLATRRMLAGAQNRIVLFTDGAANLGNADPLRLAEKIKALRQSGIAFDIAGIAADDLNDALLGELARHGNGRYYVVGKGADDDFAKQLAGAFRPAAENVKVQVRFNPERVARYKLIGFEKDRLRTEDFRNDAVDAAELAAEEAGVAIYQIEPIPDGKGETGELGVRFRDTASGEMVERTWTIPHAAAAPSIDRASPAMQLAVLAMLAGEKLKGGPLAEAIDFNSLNESRAAVRSYFGDAGRAADVLRVVEALK